jgi:hypothetical protein
MNMSRLATFLRLLPLAGAALASVATTTTQPAVSYSVIAATPPPDETAVASRIAPSLQLRLDADQAPDPSVKLQLYDAAGAPIPGSTVSPPVTGGIQDLSFVPEAPLPAGDYVLVLVGGAWGGAAEYEDSSLYAIASRYPFRSVGRELVHFATVSRPAVRLAQRDASGASFTLSFTQEMDQATLDHVQVLDATGDALPVTRTWQGGRLHELVVTSPPGGVTLSLEPGLAAADGTPVAGLPLVIDPTSL